MADTNAQWTNFASTTLASSVAVSDGTITVNTGDGALFPSPTGSQVFHIVVSDSSLNREVMKVTARSTDTFTVTRAQDGTSARAFDASCRVQLGVVRVDLEELAQNASTTQKGRIQIATNADAAAMTETDEALVPSNLDQALGLNLSEDHYLTGNSIKMKLVAFTLVLYNNSGTLQHKIVAPCSTGASASPYVPSDVITGASTTLNNTPTIGAGTDFVAGVGVESSAQYIQFNAPAAADDQGLLFWANVGFCDAPAHPTSVWCTNDSIDVNGTTRRRPRIGLFDSGGAWAPASELASGDYLYLHVYGYWTKN